MGVCVHNNGVPVSKFATADSAIDPASETTKFVFHRRFEFLRWDHDAVYEFLGPELYKVQIWVTGVVLITIHKSHPLLIEIPEEVSLQQTVVPFWEASAIIGKCSFDAMMPSAPSRSDGP
jgi:hypothetical protein